MTYFIPSTKKPHKISTVIKSLRSYSDQSVKNTCRYLISHSIFLDLPYEMNKPLQKACFALCLHCPKYNSREMIEASDKSNCTMKAVMFWWNLWLWNNCFCFFPWHCRITGKHLQMWILWWQSLAMVHRRSSTSTIQWIN